MERQLATMDKDIEQGIKAYIKVVAHWVATWSKVTVTTQPDITHKKQLIFLQRIHLEYYTTLIFRSFSPSVLASDTQVCITFSVHSG